MQQTIRFIKSADGVRLAVATSGSGAPLVKSANWLSHLEFDWQSPVWRHWFRFLSAGRQLIRFDPRGCGLSDWNAADLSLAVVLAVLLYFLFAAFVFYIRQHPFPGFAGLISLAGVTLIYAAIAFVVYVMVYGRNMNPLDTHAGRLHSIGVAVKSGVYTCIVTVVYLSFNFALRLLELQRWELFALSIFFVICALLSSMGVIKPLRQSATAPGS